MKLERFGAFVAIGSAFATVEEFLTVVVLRHDLPSYLFTLLALFPAYVGFVYAVGRILDRVVRREPTKELAYLLGTGSFGLLLEWTLMGLAPWSNPTAHPLLMFVFQLGMFAFWASVATVPRAFLDRRRPGRSARRRILRFYIPYFALVYGLGLSVPEQHRFAVLIPLILVGYLVVMGLLIWWIVELYSRDERDGAASSSPGIQVREVRH